MLVMAMKDGDVLKVDGPASIKVCRPAKGGRSVRLVIKASDAVAIERVPAGGPSADPKRR